MRSYDKSNSTMWKSYKTRPGHIIVTYINDVLYLYNYNVYIILYSRLYGPPETLAVKGFY